LSISATLPEKVIDMKTAGSIDRLPPIADTQLMDDQKESRPDFIPARQESVTGNNYSKCFVAKGLCALSGRWVTACDTRAHCRCGCASSFF
jgi:hypothetical protein